MINYKFYSNKILKTNYKINYTYKLKNFTNLFKFNKIKNLFKIKKWLLMPKIIMILK